MKHLLIILSFLLLSSPVIGQSGKPQTIIVPTGSLGDISEVRKKMLEKTLESKLDDYFDIVPKELFEEAQEQAFQEMDSDECTEEQCIMMIREILQVENSFQMVLMEEEGDTQISITWNDLDKKRVEEEYCEGCKTKQLRKMIEGLVEKLVGKINIIVNKEVVNEIPEKEIYSESNSIKIVSTLSDVGGENEFIQLKINLRSLKTRNFQIKNINFHLQVLGFKSDIPQDILIEIDKSYLTSINYDELKECSKKFNKEWLLERHNVMRLSVHNRDDIPVSDCFLSKLDENDYKILKMIITNLDKIIINGFKYGKPFINKNYSPGEEYWKIQSEKEDSFWERIGNFVIKHSQILFID